MKFRIERRSIRILGYLVSDALRFAPITTRLERTMHTSSAENVVLGTDRFLREPEVRRLTGLGRTRRWELERAGEFPRRVRLSDHAVAWRLSELREWMESRPRA